MQSYKSSFVYSPCLYGFFNPCILLPDDIEEKIHIDDLKYVIAHELDVYKRQVKEVFNRSTPSLAHLVKVPLFGI